MKNIFFLLAIITTSVLKAQTTRNDSYSALGALTSIQDIPFGVSLYTVDENEKFGFFTELKFNRLSFDSDFTFEGYPLASDTLRNSNFISNENMIKMINIGTVFNPQALGVMEWDFVDIDICIGIGYMQKFHYNFYNDSNGIEEGENQSASDPLGDYYVIDYNDHGLNVNFGTNLSFQGKPYMIHIGYDLKPKTLALGFNWKVK
tara:strand:- start:148 stop:759 length:612 start_codon:yes stop_codon:yes gene_type:complete